MATGSNWIRCLIRSGKRQISRPFWTSGYSNRQFVKTLQCIDSRDQLYYSVVIYFFCPLPTPTPRLDLLLPFPDRLSSFSRAFTLPVEARIGSSGGVSGKVSTTFQSRNFLLDILLPCSAYSAFVIISVENPGERENWTADWKVCMIGLKMVEHKEI